jgi:hypothetical protein
MTLAHTASTAIYNYHLITTAPIFHCRSSGKYFHEYAGNRYIPNNEKLQEYPGDMEVVEKLLLQHQQESMNVDSMPS